VRVASQHDVITGETTAVPVGERMVSGPQFPLGLCGVVTMYAASANTDMAARGGRPSCHIPAVRNPSTSADNESSHGFASELPPATSHGYAEWDFSGVPDLVVFRRFLDVVDYWFGYSDNSSARSYDPARECFVVVTDDQANSANVGAGDGDAHRRPETGPLQGAGPSAPPPPPRPRKGPTSTRSWPKRANSR
jgi:hypothetical protein